MNGDGRTDVRGLNGIADRVRGAYKSNRMLSFERRWLELILSSFAADGSEGLSVAGGEIDYVGTFRGVLERARFVARLGFRIALWLVALSPLWFAGRVRGFGALSLVQRQRLLGQLLEHRVYAVREAAFALKLAACLALFADDAVRARSGYDRAPTELSPLRSREARA